MPTKTTSQRAEQALARAARRDHRTLARAKLAALRQKLREAMASRKARMKELQQEARAQRLALRDRLKAQKIRAVADLREKLRKERAEAREACMREKKQARAASDDAVAVARAELAAERRRQAEERRIAREHRKRHAVHARSVASAETSNALLPAAILGQYGPLFEQVKRTLKPTPGESRGEAFLRYVETHPAEVHAVVEPKAERTIAETKAQIAATQHSIAHPKAHEIARVARRVRRPANDAKPAPAPSTIATPRAKIASFTMGEPVGFDEALDRFVRKAQEILDAHRARLYPNNSREVLTLDPGRRYVRIVRSDAGAHSRSVHCFVDRTNGDILKAASWKAPAKGARGNIFSSDAGRAVTPTGAVYWQR